MATARTWTIKGVSDATRDAVYEASQAQGFAIGEWIDRALARAADEALHPKPPAATREEVAEVVQQQLAPVVARLEALGEGVQPIKHTAKTEMRGKPPAQSRRGLSEEMKARIDELHRAGLSAYAISKRIGVSYPAARARVKALEAA